MKYDKIKRKGILLHTIIDKTIHISVFYYKNGMIYSNLLFFFDLKSDIIGINELTMILKIICQCDVRHIIMLLIKTATSLLKVSANINTSITALPIRLSEILVIMPVSTFKTAIILYILYMFVIGGMTVITSLRKKAW